MAYGNGKQLQSKSMEMNEEALVCTFNFDKTGEAVTFSGRRGIPAGWERALCVEC